MSSSSARIDPLDVYFTHSKIRPVFSGCGKRVNCTIDELTTGRTALADIPLITVLRADDGTLFSLNNRRLYVLKQLRGLGALESQIPPNTVAVRVKAPLERERLRYTRERCSLTATLMLDHESAEGDEALCSTIVDAPVKRVGLSVEVQAQMKALSKLARKGGRALRELASTLDEWQDAGTISAAQRVDIEAALAAPER